MTIQFHPVDSSSYTDPAQRDVAARTAVFMVEGREAQLSSDTRRKYSSADEAFQDNALIAWHLLKREDIEAAAYYVSRLNDKPVDCIQLTLSRESGRSWDTIAGAFVRIVDQLVRENDMYAEEFAMNVHSGAFEHHLRAAFNRIVNTTAVRAHSETAKQDPAKAMIIPDGGWDPVKRVLTVDTRQGVCGSGFNGQTQSNSVCNALGQFATRQKIEYGLAREFGTTIRRIEWLDRAVGENMPSSGGQDAPGVIERPIKFMKR